MIHITQNRRMKENAFYVGHNKKENAFYVGHNKKAE
jgi:hypothetical protein